MNDSTPDPEGAEGKTTWMPNLVGWREQIEIATRVLLFGVGVAYVIGLLILNAYVTQFGVHYLNFLQAEYVMAGITWAFLMGVGLAFYWVLGQRLKGAWDYYTSYRGRGWLRRTWGLIWSLVYAAAALGAAALSIFLIMQIVTVESYHLSNWTIWKAGGMTVFLAGLSYLSAKSVRKHLSDVMHYRTSKRSAAAIRESVFELSYQLILATLSLTLYAHFLFPYISATYGGGKPQQASLMIKGERIEVVKSLGLNVEEGKRMVGPVKILLEAPEYFLINPPDGYENKKIVAVRLDKEMVEAALYFTER